MTVKKKKPSRIVNFAVSVDHWVKIKEKEKRDKYLDFARELKAFVEDKTDVDNNYTRCTQNSSDKFG